MKVFPKVFDGGGSRLGSDDDFFPSVGKGRADFLLTVGVEPRCVIEVDAIIVCLMQQIHGFLFADSLNGKSSKAILVHLQVGLA